MNRVFRVGDESYVLYCGLDLKGHPLFLRIGAGSENLEKYSVQIRTEYIYYPNSMIGSLVKDLTKESSSALPQCVVLGKDQDGLKTLIKKYRSDTDFISVEDFSLLSPETVNFYDSAGGMRITIGQDTVFDLDEMEEKNGHFNYRIKEFKKNIGNSTHMYPKKMYDGEGFFIFRNGLYLFNKDHFLAIDPDIAFIEGLYHCGFDGERLDLFFDGREDSPVVEKCLRFLHHSGKDNVIVAGKENPINKDIFPLIMGNAGAKRVTLQNVSVGSGRKIKLENFVLDYPSPGNVTCTFPSGKILSITDGEGSSGANQFRINTSLTEFSYELNGQNLTSPLLPGIPVKLISEDIEKEDILERYIYKLGDDIRSGSSGAGLRAVQTSQKFFKDLAKTEGEAQGRLNNVLNNLINQIKLVKKEIKKSDGYLPLFYLSNVCFYLEKLLSENIKIHPSLKKNTEKTVLKIKTVLNFGDLDSSVFPMQADFYHADGGYLFRSSIGSISRSNVKYFGSLRSGKQTFSAIIDKCTNLDIKSFGEFALYAWKAKGSMDGALKSPLRGARMDMGDRVGTSSKKAVKKVAKKVEEEINDEERKRKQKTIVGKLGSHPLILVLLILLLLSLIGGGIYLFSRIRIAKMEERAALELEQQARDDENQAGEEGDSSKAGEEDNAWEDVTVTAEDNDNIAQIVFSGDVVVTTRDIRLVTNRIAKASGFDNLNRESQPDLPDPAYIEAGMVLKIPDGSDRIVVAGDTMWDIAEAFARKQVNEDFNRLNAIIEDLKDPEIESKTIVEHKESILELSKESPSASLREMALKVSKEF